MANSDYKPRMYQDDFDTDFDDIDEYLEEVTDDPARELGISREELRAGLNRTDFHVDRDDQEEADDWRESVEDLDEGDAGSAGWGIKK